MAVARTLVAELVAEASPARRAAYFAEAERIDAPLASCDARDLVSRGLAKLPHELLPARPRST
jgi:hypothetical protein